MSEHSNLWGQGQNLFWQGIYQILKCKPASTGILSNTIYMYFIQVDN
jgi:hypothetical protein